MELLVGTSLIAAFVAGIAALFAPCCITVLLPSYLGNIFREKYKIFFMTFVFFLGIATVFLPIGLGASFLAQLFSKYHNFIFAIGGTFLLILGLTMLLGKRFGMKTSARTKLGSHVSSIYLLGIFSAIATTCCAPVLAGVLALSFASGTISLGILYTLSYVLGMTLPLFVIAILLDKMNLTEKFMNAQKTVPLGIGKLKWRITASELVSGLVFLLMGGYIIYLSTMGKLFTHSNYQLEMNLWNAKFLNSIQGFVSFIPEYIWGLIFISIVAFMSYVFIKQYKNQKNDNKQ